MIKHQSISQFGEKFEAYPARTLRLKDEVWKEYLAIKNSLGKNHNYAMEQLLTKYKQND